jgi:hypothetical protein
MKQTKKILFPIAILLVFSLACSAVSSLIATPTPVPTFTPVPTNTPEPSDVLFEEAEFDSSGCFVFSSDQDVERFSEGGAYHMKINTPKYIAWSVCDTVPITGDFIFEADVTTVDGPLGNAAGLIFRYNVSTDEFYNFAVGADGYYVFTKDGYNYTEPVFLADWNTSPSIAQGKTTNHLKLEVIGGNFKFYVNDTKLGETSDSSLGDGYIGFFASAFDEGNVHVSFDNVRVTVP